ncbi:MAG TPA: hypothetical protein DEB32_03135 [Stenotrophomonas sp.]|nr:hypothetical protein [Stenotrophomonas sp.]
MADRVAGREYPTSCPPLDEQPGKSAAGVTTLTASVPFGVLFQHLQAQLDIALPDGSLALMRFYDPRAWLRYCDVLTTLQRLTLLGPVQEWQVTVQGQFWRVSRADLERTQEAVDAAAERCAVRGVVPARRGRLRGAAGGRNPARFPCRDRRAQRCRPAARSGHQLPVRGLGAAHHPPARAGALGESRCCLGARPARPGDHRSVVQRNRHPPTPPPPICWHCWRPHRWPTERSCG